MAFAGPAEDHDSDGMFDVLDNCSAVANGPPIDCDTDNDGYGNICDCDIHVGSNPPSSQSLTCTAGDLNQWKAANSASPQTNMNADHNCNGSITAGDLNIWKIRNTNSATQFKSGLSCAGAAVGGCPN
jgi:hypothetical protein